MPVDAREQPAWGDYFRDLRNRMHKPEGELLALLREQIAHALAAVGASGGSILVPDGDRRHLRFLVSAGPAADELDNILVPLDASIVGCVFSTGQLLAFGDLSEERPTNFYADVGRRIGITTRTYLAVPILASGRSLGVATYVNRPGTPPYPPFQADEIRLAVAFSRIEGVVLRHLERTEHLAHLADADMESALQMLDAGATSAGLTPDGVDETVAAGIRILRDLEQLPEEDQEFCADLIALVARRRDQGRKMAPDLDI